MDVGGEQTPDQRTIGYRNVHGCVALHPAKQTPLCLTLGSLDERTPQCQTKQEREEHHHHQATRELGSKKLPAEKNEQHQAELEDEVGGREFEDDRVG